VKLRVPVVQVEVATYLIEECDLAGTQLAALALDHLRGPTNTFRHSWTTSFLRSAILARNRPFVTLVLCQPTPREIHDISKGRHVVTPDINAAVVQALNEVGASYSTMDCDPALADTAQFCENYGIPLDRSANAIVLASKRPAGIHAMFLVLATTRLDANGHGRQLMDSRKISFASADVTSAVTGMEIGGVTPFGRPHDLPLFVDAAVLETEWVIVGGGSRDMKVKVDPEVFERLHNTEVIEGLAS
jgi:prolyl-tRNA editing enzyme YbaK/EbsC (Cys-tRNA(Pro) deacylase)